MTMTRGEMLIRRRAASMTGKCVDCKTAIGGRSKRCRPCSLKVGKARWGKQYSDMTLAQKHNPQTWREPS